MAFSRTQLAGVGVFGSGTQPPAALAKAIVSSSQKYGVPADLLAGIWRIESGSTYPNPAVNSSGYGGLFGTRQPFASTQAQANLAASILATGLQRSGGSIAGALSYYNSGRTSGGYTTVPGEISFGVASPGGTTLGGTPVTGPPARPGTGGSGGSFWGGVWGTVTGAAGSVEHAASGAFSAVEGAAEDLITGPVAFLKAAAWLVNPVTWLRVVEGMFGFTIIVGGIFVAVGDSLPTGTAETLAKVAE